MNAREMLLSYLDRMPNNAAAEGMPLALLLQDPDVQVLCRDTPKEQEFRVLRGVDCIGSITFHFA